MVVVVVAGFLPIVCWKKKLRKIQEITERKFKLL